VKLKKLLFPNRRTVKKKKKILMITITKKKIRELSGRIFVELGNRRHSILLVGTGRSGTTWIQEAINYDNSYRVMFEPFHSLKIPILKNWNYRQYLREENNNEIFLEPAKAILYGQVRHKWIDQFNKKHFVTKRIIKDIRINLILKWLKRKFPQIPIILILRHPCAVANSKLKLGWKTHLNDFLRQPDLMSDYLNPFKSEIESVNNQFDKHIFMWCIENYVPLNQFNKNEILITFYEDICLNPQKEIKIIFEYLGKELSSKVFETLSKPSFQTQKDSAIKSGNNLINSWRKNITQKEIDRAINILKLFRLDKIYKEGDMPIVKGNDILKVI
jgi:hypothetical protein